MLSLEVAAALLETFKGREDVVSYQPPGGKFSPVKVDPVPLTAERFAAKHGEGSIGLYLLRKDNTVWNAAVDFDDHGEDPEAGNKAVKFAQFMWSQGFPCYLERSQSGSGAHVWFLFERPLAAGEVRVFLHGALEDAGYPGEEVYPKQPRLTEANPYGNLIRYPLSGQSCFLSVEDQSPQEPLEFLKLIKRISVDDLMRKAWWQGTEAARQTVGTQYETEGLPQRVSLLLDKDSLLVKRWMLDTTGMQGGTSQSELMYCIAQQLVRHYVPTPEIETAIRFWCNQNGYEKGLRLVDHTVCKAYQSIIPLPEEIITDISDESVRLSVKMHSVIDSLGKEPRKYNTLGIPAVDRMFGGGSQQGWLSFIAGRPNEGKTATALQGMWELAQSGIKTALFSLEMTEEEVGRRLLLRLTDRPEEEWADPGVVEELHDLWERRTAKAAPLAFLRDAGIGKHPKSADAILERMEMLVDEGYRCMIIDYLDKIDGCMNDKEGEISRTIDKMAGFVKKFNVDLRVLAQLKRPQDGFRGFRPPLLTDLAGADRIGRDADLVLGVAEPWRNDNKKFAMGKTSFYWLKSRHGGCNGDPVVSVDFDSKHQTYSDSVVEKADDFE